MYDALRNAGAQVDMWKVGHSMIKARMKETGAHLAGEMSGHLFFADRYFGFDDAVYAGARLIELVGRSDTDLSQLVDTLPEMSFTPELRVACSDDAKFRVTKMAAEFFSSQYEASLIDGFGLSFQKAGASLGRVILSLSS